MYCIKCIALNDHFTILVVILVVLSTSVFNCSYFPPLVSMLDDVSFNFTATLFLLREQKQKQQQQKLVLHIPLSTVLPLPSVLLSTSLQRCWGHKTKVSSTNGV